MITKIIMLTATSKVNTIYVMQSIIYTYIFMYVRTVLAVKYLVPVVYLSTQIILMPRPTYTTVDDED